MTRSQNQFSSQTVGNELADSGARANTFAHNQDGVTILTGVRGRTTAWRPVERSQGERPFHQPAGQDTVPQALTAPGVMTLLPSLPSTILAVLRSEVAETIETPESIDITARPEPIDAENRSLNRGEWVTQVNHWESAEDVDLPPATRTREPREQRREQEYQWHTLGFLNRSQSEDATQNLFDWRLRNRERLIEIVSEYMDIEGVPPSRLGNLFYISAIDALFSDNQGQLMINPDEQRIRRMDQQRIAMRTVNEELHRVDALYAGDSLVERSLEEEYMQAYRLLDHLNVRGELRLEMQARLQSAIDEINRQEQMEEAWSLSGPKHV